MRVDSSYTGYSMTLANYKSATWQPLLLAIVLVMAQAGAAVHAAEHEFAAPAGKVCSTCVAAEQLSTASVDDPSPAPAVPAGAIRTAPGRDAIVSARTLPRQPRGPPATC